MGLSAGSRKALCLDWVKNLKSKTIPTSKQEKADQDASSAFALFWNLTRSVAPQEVLDDFDNYLKKLGIRRMDGAGSMPHDIATGQGNYSVSTPNYDFTFYGAELAPPTGVCGWNYSRYALSSGFHLLLTQLVRQVHAQGASAPQICCFLDDEPSDGPRCRPH